MAETTERTTRTGATIDDRRSEADKAATAFFVVATDRFMSGWGRAQGGRSLFAVPCKDMAQARIVEENMRHRSEMKRVRIVAAGYRPALRRGDHYSIRDMSDCSRFYTPGGFAE